MTTDTELDAPFELDAVDTTELDHWRQKLSELEHALRTVKRADAADFHGHDSVAEFDRDETYKRLIKRRDDLSLFLQQTAAALRTDSRAPGPLQSNREAIQSQAPNSLARETELRKNNHERSRLERVKAEILSKLEGVELELSELGKQTVPERKFDSDLAAALEGLPFAEELPPRPADEAQIRARKVRVLQEGICYCKKQIRLIEQELVSRHRPAVEKHHAKIMSNMAEAIDLVEYFRSELDDFRKSSVIPGVSVAKAVGSFTPLDSQHLFKGWSAKLRLWKQANFED